MSKLSSPSRSTRATRELGLVLKEFLDLYLRQCMEAPLDTWEELAKLGYNLNLNHNHFTKLHLALTSQVDWSWSGLAAGGVRRDPLHRL